MTVLEGRSRRAPSAGSRLGAFLLMLVVLTLLLPGLDARPASAVSGAIRTLGSPDICKKTQLALDDDNSSLAVPLPFTINFFGRSFSQLYVNNNGNVTFDAAMGTYTPFALTTTNRQIIAPFFGDVDTRGLPNSPPDGVFYSYGFSDSVLIDGVARRVFCVDWMNVGYYNQHFDKRNSFQLLIIERADVGAGNFDIEFNYDKINWETGDASGGSLGLGGYSARAGYSNGGTASLEISGSAVNGALLDSNATTGLVNRGFNSTQLGRFTFPVRNTSTATPESTSAVYGQPNATLKTTVTVDGASPTLISEGTVTFTVKRTDGTTVGTVTSGTVSAGIASASFPLAGVGATNANGSTPATYAVSARYDGTSTYNPSDSPGSGTLSVAKAASDTRADPKTIVYGQPLTLSASVVGVSPSTAMVSEGTATFAVYQGATRIGVDGEAPVAGGVATLEFQTLSATPLSVGGTYTVQTTFKGTDNYTATVGSSGAKITVGIAGTTTVATPATTRYGDTSVTLTAKVTATAPSVAQVSAGLVTFSVKDGQGLAVGTPVTATPSNGLASATFALPVGTLAGSYSISADYAGTSSFGASSAPAAALQIETALTTTTASPASITAAYGTVGIDVSATVTSPGGTPAGAVTFAIRGTTVSSTVTLGETGAAATLLPLSGVHAGGHIIDVAFSGSSNFATSAALVPLTLESVATTTVVEDASALSGAASVSLRATVTNTAPVNGGVVTFAIANADGAMVGTPMDAPVVDGVAAARYALPSGIPVGTYVVKAHYGGSQNFRSSDAAPATLTVFGGVTGIATCGGTAQPRAKVQLHSGGTLIETTDADASGRYSFANVLPGSYTVVVNDGVCGGSAVSVTGTGTPTQVTIAPPLDLNNHSWLTAYPLTLNSTASVDEHIFKPGQSAWFRFDVTPQSKLIARLKNLATNYDLTLYKDIGKAFQAITSSADLDRLSVEFANELGANELGANELGANELGANELGANELGANELGANELGANELGANELGANELGANELGANELGANELGANELGAALSSAVSRSLIAFSSRGGTSDEIIVRNVWNNTGRFYLRVRGRSGAFSLARPFRLDVNLLAGSCGTVGPVTAAGGSVVLNSTASAPFRTVILTDLARMSGAPSLTAALALPAIQTLRDRLLTFAARPEVQGAVVDVGGDAGVAAANAQAQGAPLCPFAKNVVADQIKRIVDGYRSPLEFVVLVGSDAVIPFFRYPDKAAIANEDQYYPSVLESTSSQASLRLNYVLSDDRYGSRFDVSRGDHTFPITDLAVGRLVETPAEATAVLDAYLATTDGVVTLTANALVTGYDFLEKDARAVSAELALGTARPVDELIHTRGTPLATAWNASQLVAALEQRRELVFLNGHMSQGSMLAADFVTRYLAGQYAASAVDGRNTIVMGVGCHLGYNTVDAHGLPLTPAPDWPQAFARKGATLVASTGYAYGDSDIIDFGGRLYLELAKELRAQTPSGRVAIGTALLRAKQAYLASITRMSGTHEKQLLETTLFGLPHLSLDLRGPRLARDADTSIIAGATTPLDATLGLSYADPAPISFGLTTRAVPLLDVATGTPLDPTATYLAGASGSVANPGEPILPLELRNVSAGVPLRGVGFRGGAYLDTAGVRPLTSAPATEFSSVHPLFVSDFLYPVRPWSVNYFDAVRGGATRLAITPTQYMSSAPGSPMGTRRTFGSMSFRLFYSGNTTPSALVAAPVVTGVTTTVLPAGSVRFDVTVSGEPAAGVAQAWITWTATTGPQGEWRSIDLARADQADFTRWTATVPSAAFGVPLADVRFMVQAVNGVGLVGLDTAHGRFHVPGAAVATLAAPKASATLAFASGVPAGGAYRSRVTLSAQLTSLGPVGSVPVTFSLGGQRAVGLTDGSGLATATLRVNEDPGDSVLSASVDETAQRLGAATTPVAFRVDKAPTAVTLAPATFAGAYSDPTAFVATLRRATDGVPLDQQTVFFVVTPTCATPPCAGPSYETSDITDLHGRARLEAVPLPAGSYTVRAFFLGAIPLSSGTYRPTSGVYTESSASASLAQSTETATVVYGGGTIVAVGGAVDLAATVTQDADGSPGDVARAQVRYEVKGSTGAIATTPSGPAVRTVAVNAQGIATPASIAGLAVGVYTIQTSVVGGFYATATPFATLLAVFDPNGSTAGGGHIMTTADASTVGLSAGEKGTFAFQLRYPAGAGSGPSGQARFDVRDPRGPVTGTGSQMRLEATSFDWLVAANPNAQFQGSGTINGAGSFRFRVIIRDLGDGRSGATGANTGQVDTFEIRIWDPSAAVPTSFEAPTYRASGRLSGGNVTIPR